MQRFVSIPIAAQSGLMNLHAMNTRHYCDFAFTYRFFFREERLRSEAWARQAMF
jgi:hypothetical protein